MANANAKGTSKGSAVKTIAAPTTSTVTMVRCDVCGAKRCQEKQEACACGGKKKRAAAAKATGTTE